MKIGLIGTGIIGEACIKGFYRVGKFNGEMFISRRSEDKSAALADEFLQITVLDDNQAIVDSCDLLILAVLPEQTEAVLKSLTLRPDQRMLSLVSSITLGSLAEWAAPVTKISRAIPLPPIEFGLGPIPICPATPELDFLLDPVGVVVALTDEEQFLSIAVGSALMAMYYEMTSNIAVYMKNGGLAAEEAARYASSMMVALADSTERVNYDELLQMSEDCLTPGGLNEQVLFGLREAGWYDSLEKEMEGIKTRLSKY
ncbi:MAG: NAD(P)-binding domain-containing protein [Chloroflexota bacterium]